MSELSNFYSESDLLDGAYEFYRDWFEGLSESQVASLDAYYGFLSKPQSLIDWRANHPAEDGGLAVRARGVLATVLRHGGQELPD